MTEDRLDPFIASMKEEADRIVDGMLGMIERIAVGNPRLNKLERSVSLEFLHGAITGLSAVTNMMDGLNAVRLSADRNIDVVEQNYALSRRATLLLVEIFRQVRQALEAGRPEEALAMVNRVLAKPWNELKE